MRTQRPPVSEVSRKANVVATVVATLATVLLTPVASYITHHQVIPMLVLTGVLYLAIFFYVRMKVFDLIDGA